MKNQGSSVSQDGARCEGSQNGGPGRRHVQWAQMTSSFARTIPLAGLIDLSFSRDINAEAVASVATSTSSPSDKDLRMSAKWGSPRQHDHRPGGDPWKSPFNQFYLTLEAVELC